jgi:ribose-phosphate pyrophosphokinase
MEIIKYPDSTSYVQINYKQDCPNKTFKINTYEDLWHLNQFVDACNNNDRIPIVTIPNLIDAQADRRFNKDESSGLKLVCKFLNSMKADFKIFHPHNAEVVEALIDNVEIIDNSQFIKEVLWKLQLIQKENSEIGLDYVRELNNLTLMSSDAGGFKPLMKLCDKISWQGETASASKYREYKDGKSILTQLIAHSNFRGKDILIVDDICIYGGTFKGLAKLLKEKNCGKLYLAVSHMTVQHLGEDPVTNYFDQVFTTNSKYDNYFVRDSEAGGKQPDNLTVVKMF